MMGLWGQLYCTLCHMMSSVFMVPSFVNIFMVISFNIIIIVLRAVISLTSLYMLSWVLPSLLRD